MKLILATSLTFILSFISLAQDGVIYSIMFRIDNELVTQMKSQNKDYKIVNLATVEEMPKALSDTIAYISEQVIGQAVHKTLTSIMPEDKLVTAALPEHLMYLPGLTLNKAIKTKQSDIYVSITCHIAATGGSTIVIGKDSFSKVKPKLSLSIKGFNAQKEKIYENEIVLKDFEKLRSHSFESTYGIQGLIVNTDDVTVSETLTSDDVLRMYVIALEALN